MRRKLSIARLLWDKTQKAVLVAVVGAHHGGPFYLVTNAVAAKSCIVVVRNNSTSRIVGTCIFALGQGTCDGLGFLDARFTVVSANTISVSISIIIMSGSAISHASYWISTRKTRWTVPCTYTLGICFTFSL